jgi:hypothetical protein
MILNEKVLNYKVVDLFYTKTFVYVIFPSEVI